MLERISETLETLVAFWFNLQGLFFFSFSFVKYDGGQVISYFSWKQRRQSPPPWKPPKMSSQRYLCCDKGTIWAGAAVAPLRGTRFSHAQIGGRSGWVPLQCYLIVRTSLYITYTQSPSNHSCFCSTFCQKFVIGDSASSKGCLYQPLPLQLSSFAHLAVLARGTQVCTKTWQFILLIYLRLLLFIDSFPSWSKLWAPLSQWEFCLFLSSGQDFFCHLQIPSWTCSPFYHLCLLWNLLPILLKYSFFFFQCHSP